MGYPTVYPTSTTIYYPDQCYNGYTLFSGGMSGHPYLIDMNGNVVHEWRGMTGFPAKLLPGGFIMGSTGLRNPKYGYQDKLDLIQVDWHGNVVWRFDKYERIKDPYQKKARWMARQHHDYQRPGNPVGYYAPNLIPGLSEVNTLILCHKNVTNPDITEKTLIDDTIIEVDWEGNIIWEWTCSEHFDDLSFSEESRNTMHRNPNMVTGNVGDWMHMNAMSTLGPNKWYADGDERFHPDNIIWSGRQTSIIGITNKKTGKIVWTLGPDYHNNDLGWIIGPHHAHMIPQGLPGEGNILLFDNGGMSGYGAPNPTAPQGINNARRDYSRVIEFNPQTLEIVWQYTPKEAGLAPLVEDHKFYSVLVSSVQRLPNGNTLITEGTDGRLFEVTPEHELVWEYISPYIHKERGHNLVYRGYRLPYDWVPQVEKPEEIEVPQIDNSKFRVNDAGDNHATVAKIKRGGKVNPDPALCVLPPGFAPRI